MGRTKKLDTNPYAGTDYTTVEGILMRVSDVQPFSNPTMQGVKDMYRLGIKTPDGKRILISISTTALGWFGDINKSKIWYYNPKRKYIIKISLHDPTKYLYKKLRVTGFMVPISEVTKKYKMNDIQEIVLFIDEPSQINKKDKNSN